MGDPRINVKVTTDAKEASAAFTALAKDIKEVKTESVSVSTGIERVDAAMAKLAKAPDTPLALGRAIAKAKVELEDLRAALEKTPASAEKMAAITTAMAKADAAIANATRRAGRLKDAMEETTLSVEKSKDRVSAYGAALSSPAAAMDKLRDSTSKFDQSIGKVGGSLIVAQQGFELAQKAGQALAKAIDEWDAKRAANDKRTADAAVNTIKFEAAMRLAEKGVIGVGGSVQDLIKRYDEYVAKNNPTTKATEAQTKAFEDQKKAAEALGEAIKNIGQREAFTLKGPEDAFMPIGEAQKYAERLNDVLKKAFADGGAEEREVWYKANQETIDKVIAAYQHFGQQLPDEIKAAYDKILADQGAKRLADDTEKWLGQMSRAYDHMVERVNASRDADYFSTHFNERAPAQFKAIQDAAFGAAVAAGQFGTDLDAVAEATVKVGGTLQVGTPMLLEVARASDEARASIEGLIDSMGRLQEKSSEVFEKAQGWEDYLAGIRDGFLQGTTSLNTYIGLLQAFETQIKQTFAGAGGEAQAQIQKVIDAIESLVAAAISGKDSASGPGLDAAAALANKLFGGK